jgi:hypothetical protein
MWSFGMLYQEKSDVAGQPASSVLPMGTGGGGSHSSGARSFLERQGIYPDMTFCISRAWYTVKDMQNLFLSN